MLATCICLNGSLLDQLSCTIVYLHNLFTCTFGRIKMSVYLSVCLPQTPSSACWSSVGSCLIVYSASKECFWSHLARANLIFTSESSTSNAYYSVLSFYFRPPTNVYVAVTSSRIDQSSWNMHQIKAEWLMIHTMYVTQLFCFWTYDSLTLIFGDLRKVLHALGPMMVSAELQHLI